MTDRMKQMGSTIEMGDLVFGGERSDVVDYLTRTGWTVTTSHAREAHAANGFEFPDEWATEFGDMSYVRATLG